MADDSSSAANAPAGRRASLRWGRILIAALLVEVVLFAVAASTYMIPGGADLLLYLVPPLCLIVSLYFGYWAARTASANFVLHGALVGIIAAIAYVGLTWGQALPMAYVVSHFLKVIGGTTGGFIAYRSKR